MTITQVDGHYVLTISGGCLLPGINIEIWLFSDPVHLGSVRTDASGHYSLTAEVPASTPAGTHHVVALAAGDPVALTATNAAPVTLSAPQQTSPLVRTGLDVLRITAVAAGFLAVGAFLRRRRFGVAR